LRVHCAHLGCPILGDPQYGTENSLFFSREKGINTQLLCAKKLELTHPVNKAPLVLESKLDAFIGPL